MRFYPNKIRSIAFLYLFTIVVSKKKKVGLFFCMPNEENKIKTYSNTTFADIEL